MDWETLYQNTNKAFGPEIVNELMKQKLTTKKFNVRDIEMRNDKQPEKSEDLNIHQLTQKKMISFWLEKIKEASNQQIREWFPDLELGLFDLMRLKNTTVEDVMRLGQREAYNDAEKAIWRVKEISNIANEVRMHQEPAMGFEKKPEEMRIYINISGNENGSDFLLMYAQKCIENNIPYSLKGMRKLNLKEKDKCILYVNVDDMLTVIDILEEIGLERPDIVADFGTPPHASGIVKSQNSQMWYGLGNQRMAKDRSRNNNGDGTYNDYVDHLAELSFLTYFFKELEENPRFWQHLGKVLKKEEPISNEVLEKIVNTVTSGEWLQRFVTNRDESWGPHFGIGTGFDLAEIKTTAGDFKIKDIIKIFNTPAGIEMVNQIYSAKREEANQKMSEIGLEMHNTLNEGSYTTNLCFERQAMEELRKEKVRKKGQMPNQMESVVNKKIMPQNLETYQEILNQFGYSLTLENKIAWSGLNQIEIAKKRSELQKTR